MHLLSSLACAAALPSLITAFPNAPFTTAGRWIHDSVGANFTYAGVNWPGAADVMIPEGLQYQSVASIVSKIKSLNMNIVRLTFAIEMVDDILDRGGDVTVQNALTKALGSANGTKVWQQMVSKNPSFTTSTTRLQVFDAVAAELGKQGVYVHLDNHMSKGAWCCNTGDGNSWFGDTYFNVDKWKRGLQYMANHGKSWSNLVSIGLRNELRQPTNTSPALAYNWSVWYQQVMPAATVVNQANPNILIFLSGLNFDTLMTPIPGADDLGDGHSFHLTDYSYAKKLVLELHNYQNTATSCSSMESGLWNNGFRATYNTDAIVNKMPVVLTEFGFSQATSDYSGVYASCIRTLMSKWQTGWTVWVLAGSYYIRSGEQDREETWGLLSHDWSAWRNKNAIDALKSMVTASFSV